MITVSELYATLHFARRKWSQPDTLSLTEDPDDYSRAVTDLSWSAIDLYTSQGLGAVQEALLTGQVTTCADVERLKRLAACSLLAGNKNSAEYTDIMKAIMEDKTDLQKLWRQLEKPTEDHVMLALKEAFILPTAVEGGPERYSLRHAFRRNLGIDSDEAWDNQLEYVERVFSLGRGSAIFPDYMRPFKA